MSFSHTLSDGYKDSSGVTQNASSTVSADSERNFDGVIPVSTTRLEIDLALVRANVKSFMIYSDKALEVLAQQITGKAVEGTVNTNSVDAQINITAHGYSVGQRVHISGIAGSTNLNGWFYVKTVVDADHFKLSLTSGGSTVQGNGAAYVSGGTVQLLSTMTLLAGQMLKWNSVTDALAALQFAWDTDAFYATNASGSDAATLKIRVLADQTP